MTRYLLDTDTLSDLVKRTPRPALLGRLAGLPSATIYSTVISVFELRLGCRRRGAGGDALWKKIQDEVLGNVQILTFGPRHAIRAGDLLGELLANGTPIGVEDTLIAAIALVEDACVVTGNVRHFARVPGLRVENWLE